MIRPTTVADTDTLVHLAEATGVFKPIEIVALREVLDDYHTTNHRHGHRAITFEQSATVVGFAYYAPAAMTDHTWYLYWIAVTRQTQARGIGGKLLHYVEEDIARSEGRVLVHRNVVPKSLRLNATILSQAPLRASRHDPRLLRRRRPHGGVQEEAWGKA